MESARKGVKRTITAAARPKDKKEIARIGKAASRGMEVCAIRGQATNHAPIWALASLIAHKILPARVAATAPPCGKETEDVRTTREA